MWTNRRMPEANAALTTLAETHPTGRMENAGAALHGVLEGTDIRKVGFPPFEAGPSGSKPLTQPLAEKRLHPTHVAARSAQGHGRPPPFEAVHEALHADQAGCTGHQFF